MDNTASPWCNAREESLSLPPSTKHLYSSCIPLPFYSSEFFFFPSFLLTLTQRVFFFPFFSSFLLSSSPFFSSAFASAYVLQRVPSIDYILPRPTSHRNPLVCITHKSTPPPPQQRYQNQCHIATVPYCQCQCQCMCHYHCQHQQRGVPSLNGAQGSLYSARSVAREYSHRVFLSTSPANQHGPIIGIATRQHTLQKKVNCWHFFEGKA